MKLMELESELRKATKQLDNAICNLVWCVPAAALLSS